MKTPAIIFLTCLSGLGMISCKPLVMQVSGLRQPSPESVQSVQDYLKKHQIDSYDSLFICKDSAAVFDLITMIQNVPGTLLYDRDGLSVQQSDSGYCPGKVTEFMKSLSPSSSIRYDQRPSKQELLRRVTPVEGNQGTSDPADYTLVVFWATYCGSLNKGVFSVMDAGEKNPAIRLKIYLVNLDFMDAWHMNPFPEFRYH